jgi:hypothetical protein
LRDGTFQVDAARAAVPGVTFEIVPAAGEAPAIIEALADFALDSLV